MNEYLKSGVTGCKSSKRLWGTVFIIIGGGLKVLGALASIKYTFADPAVFNSCTDMLLWISGGLLGLGVFDGIGKKIGGN